MKILLTMFYCPIFMLLLVHGRISQIFTDYMNIETLWKISVLSSIEVGDSNNEGSIVKEAAYG